MQQTDGTYNATLSADGKTLSYVNLRDATTGFWTKKTTALPSTF